VLGASYPFSPQIKSHGEPSAPIFDTRTGPPNAGMRYSTGTFVGVRVPSRASSPPARIHHGAALSMLISQAARYKMVGPIQPITVLLFFSCRRRSAAAGSFVTGTYNLELIRVRPSSSRLVRGAAAVPGSPC
jgi:hypothetical protein